MRLCGLKQATKVMNWHLALAVTLFYWYFRHNLFKKKQKKNIGVTHLCQLWRLDLFYLEKITNGQEGDGHGTDADHKNDQRWTVVDVASQVLYRV